MKTKKMMGSILSIAFLACGCVLAQPAAARADAAAGTQSNVKPFLGRWDITIKTPKGEAPAWIELSEQSGELKALMVGRWGGVCPVAEVDVTGGVLTFASAKEGDCDTKLAFKGKLEHGKLTGSATGPRWNSLDVGRCSCSGVEPDDRLPRGARLSSYSTEKIWTDGMNIPRDIFRWTAIGPWLTEI